MNNINTGNISVNDIFKLKRLKDAWSYVIEHTSEYFTMLIYYYETSDNNNIKRWIYDNCIDGVE